MQTSVKEIIESIETIATVYFSDEIKYIGFNKYPKSEVEKDCIALVYYIDSYPTAVNTSKVAIRFEFLDLISTIDDRDERRKEVFSDTDGVATAFIQYLSNNNHYIDDNTTKEAIEPKTNDGIGGTSITAVFNYEKSCIITGDGYKFKALTVGQLINTDEDFTVAIADVTDNTSGLDGTFKSVSTTDADLNLSLNEAKTILTLQTDVGTDRFSNVNFIATNGVINSSANIVNYISFVVAELLLDLYPNAAAAYSLRKLRTLYEGSVIRVRRSSDNAEQDIGFVDDVLDTASLLSFVGAGDGFITIWYDQSVSNNILQTSASSQPKIVSSGALITKGGISAIDFDGVNDNLKVTTPVLNEIDISHFSVSSSNSTETIGTILCQSHTTVESIRVFNDSRSTSTPPRNFVATVPPTTYINAGMSTARVNTNQRLLSSFIDSSKNMAAFDNGSTGGTDTYVGSITASDGLMIGAQAGLTYLNGRVQEIIVYNSDQIANRVGIEANINTYYSIY